jgi:exo-1,4-beta-D-glucosaminidase
VYWVSPKTDVLNWDNSTWYTTPVTKYANYQMLEALSSADVAATVQNVKPQNSDGWTDVDVQLENKSKVPAVFLRLNAIKSSNGAEIVPVFWSDNYVTLWPGEKLVVSVGFEGDMKETVIELSGRNVKKQTLKSPK